MASASHGVAPSAPLQALFVTCIFLSAFLLFLVQPIIAKQIMPWFGGSSAVWTTALMFFQLVLLAGYVYTDLATRRLRPRTHAWLHVALLVLAAATLPIVPGQMLRPDPQSAPIGQVLLVLLVSVGLPYFCLATTSPLLQAWYSRLFPGQKVYRLFALSNLASLVGLLAYPFAIEPVAEIGLQSRGWSWGFGLFTILCAACAWTSLRSPSAPELAAPVEAERTQAPAARAPTRADQALWLLLSGMGSALLLAVTHHLTQNIAPVPLLWLLPLSLYLLTFILCFEGRSWYRRSVFTAPLILLLAAMAWVVNVPMRDVSVSAALSLYAVGCFVCCMFFHGELSQRRPEPRHLTRFYLFLSLGGALGGLAVSALAPWLLNNYYELPLMLLATSLVMLWLLRHYLTARPAAWPVLLLALASCALTGLMGWVFHQRQVEGNVSMQRNFYASSRVTEFGDGAGGVARVLFNGSIVHGTQLRSAASQRIPTTYYGSHSGVAYPMDYTAGRAGRRVGVIGLGVGTMAAWGRAGDAFRFYEINPHSVQIADRDFSYLKDSGASHEVVLGDARLMMASELAKGQPGRFDVLVVDAFSGDAIPVHLLTREALAIYRQHLAPDGIIAFHVSNLYLELAPLVRQLAEDAGMQAVRVDGQADAPEFPSTWVMATTDKGFLALPALRQRLVAIPSRQPLPVWTDAHNNLVEVLK